MIKVWACRSFHSTLFTGRCWHARCIGCGVTTAFDFTAREAREIVQAGCTCEAR